MDHDARLAELISRDAARIDALQCVFALKLPDCWIGAGFVRDAVWDDLHGRQAILGPADVDVIWYDPAHVDRQVDRDAERLLNEQRPHLAWSVKNQARMHLRNGDRAYHSVADAMCHWPETATAVAVRLRDDGSIEVNAPFGLDDLFSLRLKPTPRFVSAKRQVFQNRLQDKQWLDRYPLLRTV